MPCCCVFNCSERSERGTRLFLLPQGPKNQARRKQWINYINRKGLPDRAYVCEKHFEYDQFENNRADQKRPLRWNAIPTIFTDNKNSKLRKPLKVRVRHNKERKNSECEILEPNVVEEPLNLLDETTDTSNKK